MRAAVLLLAALVACSEPAPGTWPITFSTPTAAPHERVLLVTIDTLRPDHLSCYGYPRPTSPFLDRLAAGGARFTHALSSISHTAPAHATMLTGLPPTAHGLKKNGQRLPADAVTLPQLFGAAGYETAAFYNVRFLGGVADDFDHARGLPNQGHLAVDAAIEWLRTGRSSDRFFLWLHLYDPHHWNQPRLTPDRELADLRAADPFPDDDARYAFLTRLHGTQDVEATERREQLIAWLDAYDAQILYADRQLERFHQALVAEGLADDTLWVVTSDHGEGLGAHGYAGHTGRIYNEQLLVPLIVYTPDGRHAGRTVDALVQHVDLVPTFAELLGARVEGFDQLADGRSFLPLLDDAGLAGDERAADERAADERDADGRAGDGLAFAERADLEGKPSLHALQTRTAKLLVHGDGTREFYDLRADPYEHVDLGATPERARLEALLARLLALQAARAPEVEDDALPDEWAEELRALGYAE